MKSALLAILALGSCSALQFAVNASPPPADDLVLQVQPCRDLECQDASGLIRDQVEDRDALLLPGLHNTATSPRALTIRSPLWIPIPKIPDVPAIPHPIPEPEPASPNSGGFGGTYEPASGGGSFGSGDGSDEPPVIEPRPSAAGESEPKPSTNSDEEPDPPDVNTQAAPSATAAAAQISGAGSGPLVSPSPAPIHAEQASGASRMRVLSRNWVMVFRRIFRE